MDVERHTVAVSGTPVELTRREFDLLHHLLDHLEGDKKPEVDGPVHGFAHGLRPAAVLFDFLRRPPAGLVAFVEGN